MPSVKCSWPALLLWPNVRAEEAALCCSLFFFFFLYSLIFLPYISAKQILAVVMKNLACARLWCTPVQLHPFSFPSPHHFFCSTMRRNLLYLQKCNKLFLWILTKKNTQAKSQQFHITSVSSVIKSYRMHFPGLRGDFCFQKVSIINLFLMGNFQLLPDRGLCLFWHWFMKLELFTALYKVFFNFCVSLCA